MRDLCKAITILVAITSSAGGIPVAPAYHDVSRSSRYSHHATIDLLASLAHRSNPSGKSSSTASHDGAADHPLNHDRQLVSTHLSLSLPDSRNESHHSQEEGTSMSLSDSQHSQLNLHSQRERHSRQLSSGAHSSSASLHEDHPLLYSTSVDQGKASLTEPTTSGPILPPSNALQRSEVGESSITVHDFEDLLEYQLADGTKRKLTYDDVLSVVGMTRYKLNYMQKYNPQYEAVYGISHSNQLPSFQGRRLPILPSLEVLRSMVPELQQKWVNALKLTKDLFISGGQDGSKEVVLSSDTPRSQIEVLPDGLKEEDLSDEQRKAIAKHFKTHNRKMTMKLGFANSGPRQVYLASHRSVRKAGVPWPSKLRKGHPPLTIDGFKARKALRNASKKRKRLEEAEMQSSSS